MTVEPLWITVSDGTRLAADLYLPDGDDGPWPVLLEALPYRKDDLTASYAAEYERLRDEGRFAVVRLDLRGTGSSAGIATDEYPAEEQRDLVDVIAWLADRPWSTGRVGMWGTSYSGFNSIQVACERPAALGAIVAIYATDDRYTDDVHYMGGVLKAIDLVDYVLYMAPMNALPPVPAVHGEGWEAEWERRVTRGEPWLLRWIEEQWNGPYWRHGSLRPGYERIACPTMLVGGWADGYRNNSFRTFERLQCPKRLLMGPWSHASTATSLPGPHLDLVPELIAWFDRWLRDVDNGVDRRPPVEVFVRRSTRPEPDLTEVRGAWRAEAGWPLDRARAVVLRPSPAAGVDELAVRGDVGTAAWLSCAGGLPWGQPTDQRPDEAWSLVYDWAPLADELEVLGHVRVRASVTADVPVAQLAVKLCDVFPDGTSALVTRGILNLSHRASSTQPEPLVPGSSAPVEVELEATSWVFEAGHRVRLDIAGADWPNTWPPPTPATLTIDRSMLELVLPVVDGPAPIATPPVFTPSKGRDLHAPDVDEGGPDRPPVVWRIEHDVLARETRAVIDHGSVYDAPHGARVLEHYDGVVGVSTADPGRAWADGHVRFSIRWPDVECSTDARLRVRSDASTFHVELELDAFRDGMLRWNRRWDREIPRRLG